MIPVFKNVWGRSTAKNYHPVSLLIVVSNLYEKLVNNITVDHLWKCDLFSDFQYGFRSSRYGFYKSQGGYSSRSSLYM